LNKVIVSQTFSEGSKSNNFKYIGTFNNNNLLELQISRDMYEYIHERFIESNSKQGIKCNIFGYECKLQNGKDAVAISEIREIEEMSLNVFMKNIRIQIY